MKLIGFAFTRLHSYKAALFKSKSSKTLSVDITNVEADELPVASKDLAYKVSFLYKVAYSEADSKKENSLGEVTIEGQLHILADDAASKDLLKTWKKKETPESVRQPLFNIIMRKCSVKALQLEEDVGLPSHIPIPQVRLSKK